MPPELSATSRMMATAESRDDRERHRSDLYTRPGWVDASFALTELDQGRATGDRGVLWLRSRLHRQLHSLGRLLDAHAARALFLGILAMAACCVWLKNSSFHTEIEQMWAEKQPADDGPQQEILSTHQMLIQTAVDPNSSLLHAHGLLEHLEILRKASEVTVTLFDIVWKLKDICQSPSIPNFDEQYMMEKTYDNFNPCSIITPLDCFWEGSKLLGPEYPVALPNHVKNMKWTHLNPAEVVKTMKMRYPTFNYETLDDFFRRGGITTGYQEKPCLNPKDPECPKTAPNHNSSKPLDIGATLTNGCYGYVAKYMHWPEELLVGGVTKNKTGHIKHAKALQTVFQLMDKFELHDYYKRSYKVNHIDWSEEKASMVLNAWQKKFTQDVQRLKQNMSKSYKFHAFSTATLNKGLIEYIQIEKYHIGFVFLGLMAFGWAVQSLLVSFGVILLVAATAAGLGVCSLLGFPMNLLSTHVLPYLSVGLSMRDMFLLLSVQKERNISPAEMVQRCGLDIITSTMLRSAAFLIATVVLTPALRIFCLQCVILSVFHGAAILFLFPALLALKIRFRKAGVPCFRNESKMPPNNNNNTSNVDPEHGENLMTEVCVCKSKRKSGRITFLVNQYWIGFIFSWFMKMVLWLGFMAFIGFSVYNGMNIRYDVRLSSFLPKTMDEYNYLEAQNKYFGFYNFYLVTTELEYPIMQNTLYKYHAALRNVPNVLKDSNGGVNMNNFWLANFRDFLIDLQQQFEKCDHCVSGDKWYSNATENAVLAFRLLAQTGIVEFPVDKSQIMRKKLVQDGIIDVKAFYNYLSVWSTSDHLSYSSAQANLDPKPYQHFNSTKAEHDLTIPKSQRIKYAQIPFYLKDMRSTSKIVETLKQIKDISEEYNNLGLPNYPKGLLFAYFNQFILFEKLLLAQLVLTLLFGAIMCCFIVQYRKIWSAMFCIVFGLLLMALMDLNALTGTMGAVHFIVISRNVLLLYSGFLSALGGRNKRVKMSLEIYIGPILKGDVGLLFSVAILALSPFEFISGHIFQMVCLSVIGSMMNSLIVTPLMLDLVGPKGELQPLVHNDRMSTPPPPPVQPTAPPKPVMRTSKRAAPSKAIREPSLTTISEESSNQSIIVEPQVTVEYSTPEPSSTGQFTTKVTATTNVKVEFVAPMYRPPSSHSSKCHRTKCSRCQHQCRCCKQDPESSDSSGETDPCAYS